MEPLFDPFAMLEAIADTFFVLDSEERLTFINAAAAKAFGPAVPNVLGEVFTDAFPELRDSELAKRVQESLREKTAARFEHFLPRLNRWFEQQTYVNPRGGLAVFGRDITARRRLQEALRASEERFRTLVDSNIIGVFVTTGGKLTEANDCFLKMIAYSRDDVIRQQLTWSQITLPEQRALDKATIQDLSEHRFCSPYERDLFNRDQVKVPVLIASTRVDQNADDSDPDSWEILHVAHNLTHRKRAETRLRHLLEATKILNASLNIEKGLSELARFLVRNVGDFCAIYVTESNELYKAAQASRGPEFEFHATDVAKVPEMRIVLSKGTSEILKNGGVIVPLPSHGKIAGALFLSSNDRIDHDDLHFLEEVGRRAGIALENTRLYYQVQTANHLKDEFVASLSHELRTPLTPILGGIYMLRAEPEDKRIFDRALDIIERNAKAQSKIVEDLLDLSRIISGRLRLQFEPVHLEAALQVAVESVRAAAEAKGISLRIEATHIDGIVQGDFDRLQQVFWNLLSNSVKFTPKGGQILIEVAQNGDHAEVRFSDTGIGIREEFLPFVFDRFRQEDTSRTRVHRGLGLAIVRHLVESHGGTVHAHSLGNQKGSTFIVKLPLRAESTLELQTRLTANHGTK